MSEPFSLGTRRNVILCEGYQDRAFWKGLLIEAVGCAEARKDPRGRPVTGGRYGYRTPSDRYIEVVPADTRSELIRLLVDEVRDAEQPPVLGSVLFNFDPDTDDPTAADQIADSQAANLAGLLPADAKADVERVVPRAGHSEERAAVRIKSTGEAIFVSPWRCERPDGGDKRGVPAKQTLERLTCAAVTEIYPERGAAVHEWLSDNRVTPPKRLLHKAAAQSLMAGWQPDRGSEGFFESVWEDEAVRGELIRLLTSAGVWAAIGRLLGKG